MEFPDGLEDLAEELRGEYSNTPNIGDTGKENILLLKKSLYGLHQSGKLWNEKLNDCLISNGFKRSIADPCVYHDPNREILVGVYVDDLPITGSSEEIAKTKKMIKSNFSAKDLGIAKEILNIKITQGKRCIKMSQENYSRQILKDFHMDEAHPAATPMDPGTKLEKTKKGDGLNEVMAARYRTGVGCLMYLANNTRPDLSFTGTHLSQFNKNPSQAHWTALKHALRYLKGTTDIGISYQMRHEEKMIFYSDADWGSDISDRKSFSGYAVLLNNGLIHWKTKKQKCVALSTTEAELIGMSETNKECMWTRNFLNEINQGRFLPDPIKIRCDNQGAINIAKNHTTSERTKHIDIKVLQIRDEVHKGNLTFQYVNTNENRADIFTKNVSKAKLNEHMKNMGIVGETN
jgi:hypothetical protein